MKLNVLSLLIKHIKNSFSHFFSPTIIKEQPQSLKLAGTQIRQLGDLKELVIVLKLHFGKFSVL